MSNYLFNYLTINLSLDLSKGFVLKLYSFNNIKLKLIISFLKLKFLKNFNFFLKIYLRSLNNKFINFIKYKENSYYNRLNNVVIAISRCFYSVIFKNGFLFLNYIAYLISS